jgi:lysophospholipase L1-like esterase
VIKSLLTLALVAAALVAGCSGRGPTAPDPQAPPIATPPPVPPAPPPSPSPPAPQPPAPPMITRTRFLAFGDSVTAGTTSPALTRALSAGLPQSYPYKLQSLLGARYTTQIVSVFNEGLPLEEAADGVRRLPGLLRSASPDVVIILEGANDLVSSSVVSRTLGYLNTMARDARLAGARVVLCTLPPQRPGGVRTNDPTAVASYNAGIRDLARGEGAILVDLSREMDLSLIGVDGLHPTEAGYDRMAQILFAMIRTQFERASTTAHRHGDGSGSAVLRRPG